MGSYNVYIGAYELQHIARFLFSHYIVRIGTNNFLSINKINEQNILFIIARYHKILSSCKFHKRWDFCLIAEKFIDCD